MVLMEDLFDEDNSRDFALAREKISDTVIFGDDLMVTNLYRIKRAYDRNSIDGFVSKTS